MILLQSSQRLRKQCTTFYLKSLLNKPITNLNKRKPIAGQFWKNHENHGWEPNEKTAMNTNNRNHITYTNRTNSNKWAELINMQVEEIPTSEA